MSIKTEIKEEREYWLKSGKSIEEYYFHQESKKNIVYPPLKKVIYKGIELCENDLIKNNINSDERYIIVNFKEDNTPIVTLISDKAHDYFNKEWEFGEQLLKIVPQLNN